MRKSSAGVSLGLTAVMAASLAGCSSSDSRSRYTETKSDYGKVCRDTRTDERVSDDRCEHRSGHVGWWFIPLAGGRRVPSVGQKLDRSGGGTGTLPRGKTSGPVGTSGGDYAKSGTVSRGGFGHSGGGSGS